MVERLQDNNKKNNNNKDNNIEIMVIIEQAMTST